MTEKRYYNIITTGHIKDELTGELLKGSAIGDRLNEQHETIERLKRNFKALDEVKCELAEENEQLKQRNNRQYEQLDRLYNLIEQKDWRALNDILDDFKKCDEQLRREWGTYGDVE